MDREKETVLFTSLTDLIKHTDGQIASYNKFFLMMLTALIPLMVFLVDMRLGLIVYIGVGCLAISIAINWSGTVAKLRLDKLCWTENVRELENLIFSGQKVSGPFSNQVVFFDKLPTKKEIPLSDRLLVDKLLAGKNVGTTWYKIAWIIFLTLALFLALVGLLVK